MGPAFGGSMNTGPSPGGTRRSSDDAESPLRPIELPMAAPGLRGTEPTLSPLPRRAPPVPAAVPRGVVLFDLDGTILDDLGAIAEVAADVMFQGFGTPVEEGRIHYLATTGMPFEAQLAQLYPDVLPPLRAAAARTFHQRKVTEAYAKAKPFPEMPKVLKRLSVDRWTLSITTGAETEMADLILEREGLRYWFEDVLGSAEGTKREHLAEYRRRYPHAKIFLVGDSRFDMEAAASSEGVTSMGRASSLPGWTLSPKDLIEWGAAWADYSLGELPEALARLERSGGRVRPAATGRARRAKK
jgi:phosphoglycolate phosphatase-like HAD superfamily hydrolase